MYNILLLTFTNLNSRTLHCLFSPKTDLCLFVCFPARHRGGDRCVRRGARRAVRVGPDHGGRDGGAVGTTTFTLFKKKIIYSSVERKMRESSERRFTTTEHLCIQKILYLTFHFNVRVPKLLGRTLNASLEDTRTCADRPVGEWNHRPRGRRRDRRLLLCFSYSIKNDISYLFIIINTIISSCCLTCLYFCVTDVLIFHFKVN